MDLAEWRNRYQASASEILDLLEYSRRRSRSPVKTLLENGVVEIELPEPIGDVSEYGEPFSLEPMRDGPSPAPLVVYSGAEIVASTSIQDHADLRAVLDTGLTLDVEVDVSDFAPVLRLSLPFTD
jgi:hypothetical protein